MNTVKAVFGILLLALAVWGGRVVSRAPAWARVSPLKAPAVA